MPIIQVSVGKFGPMSGENALCVLFFKKFSVFSINFSNNGISCKLLYENNLQRNAYNMEIGPFGGGKNRDFICVQSCDGFLMIYEQDKFASLSQLNEYILPSPLFYVEVTDSFILQNSSMELESYRYSSIGANFNSQKENKLLYPDWTINLGEAARKITGFWRTEKNFEIFVLTETMLFVVSHTGALLTHKKLEYPPCNIFMYENPMKSAKSNLIYEQGQNSENVVMNPATFVISSFTHHILVYKDFQLNWASKMNNIAHGIEISMFDGQKGLLTTVNEEGWLEVFVP
jgi:Bardet-Biedl syndrome 9 protein